MTRHGVYEAQIWPERVASFSVMQVRLKYDTMIKCLKINHHTLPTKKSLVVGITLRPGSRRNPLLYLV
jgi:hypothetical protein